jgi:hypothetical protein
LSREFPFALALVQTVARENPAVSVGFSVFWPGSVDPFASPVLTGRYLPDGNSHAHHDGGAKAVAARPRGGLPVFRRWSLPLQIHAVPYYFFVYTNLITGVTGWWLSGSDEGVAAGPTLRNISGFELEIIDMKKLTKILLVPLLAGASALPLSSAQAWWGGPGWGGPWGYQGPYGYHNWTDGLGYMLGDLWGDFDFRVHFSLYGHGDGYGRGYGNYHNYYGHGYYGYPGYWGAYPAYHGVHPGYVMPQSLPAAQPPVAIQTQK